MKIQEKPKDGMEIKEMETKETRLVKFECSYANDRGERPHSDNEYD